MNIAAYGRKYKMARDTIVKRLADGTIKGSKADGGNWYVYDLAPGEYKDTLAKAEEESTREPKMAELLTNIKIVVNNEIKKLKALSFSTDGNIGTAHHKALAMLMDKIAKLIEAEEKKLRTMDLLKLSTESLEEVALELVRRVEEKNDA